MEKYEWEIATGITVLRETPFIMKWDYDKKKEAFYAKNFDELEQEIYELLKIFALKGKHISMTDPDYVLETRRLRVVHRPDLHPRLMTVMQTCEAYTDIRLYDVTGACVDQDGFYIDEVEQPITYFLNRWAQRLKNKTDHLIQEYVKPAYECRETQF